MAWGKSNYGKSAKEADRHTRRAEAVFRDEATGPRRAKKRKTYRLEYRVRSGVVSPGSRFLSSLKDWSTYQASYATDRDRMNALDRLNRVDRFFEYRLPAEYMEVPCA